MSRYTSDRAASTVIGVILLVALTIILVVSVSTWIFGLAEQTKQEPGAMISADAEATIDASRSYITVRLMHNAGETPRTENLKIIVSSDNKSAAATGFPIEGTNIRNATLSGDTEMFASGRYTLGGGLSRSTDKNPESWVSGEPLMFRLNASNIPSPGSITVKVVDRSSQTVITKETAPAVETDTILLLGGSIHTTGDDFGAAASQEGFAVEGSGKEASLTYTYNSGGLDLMYVGASSFDLQFRDVKTGDDVTVAPDVGSIGSLADINRDNSLDLLYQNMSSKELRYVDGLGRKRRMEVGGSEVGSTADYDSDGDRDVSYVRSGSLAYVDGGGNVTTIGSKPMLLGGTGDVDSDGDPDIPFKYEYSSSYGIYYLAYADGGGGGVTTTTTQIVDVGPVKDLNGDNRTEVVYINSTNHLNYATVTDSGTVTDVVSLGATEAFRVAGDTVTDIDGDGDRDVAYVTSNEDLRYADLRGNVTDTGIKALSAGPVGQFGGVPNASYVSANHTLANQSTGLVYVTLTDASLTATWERYNASTGTWQPITNATYTSSGVHSVSFQRTSQPVRVRIDVQARSKDAVAKIHAEATQR